MDTCLPKLSLWAVSLCIFPNDGLILLCPDLLSLDIACWVLTEDEDCSVSGILQGPSLLLAIPGLGGVSGQGVGTHPNPNQSIHLCSGHVQIVSAKKEPFQGLYCGNMKIMVQPFPEQVQGNHGVMESTPGSIPRIWGLGIGWMVARIHETGSVDLGSPADLQALWDIWVEMPHSSQPVGILGPRWVFIGRLRSWQNHQHTRG